MKQSGIIAATRPARALIPIVILGLAFLAAGRLGFGPIAMAQDQTGSVSFNTPEEAITFYMQGMAQGDTAQILQACAVNEMSEKFRFDLYIDKLRALTLQAPAPSGYPFYAEMNKAQFSSQILFQTKNLAYGLLTTEEELLDGRSVYDIDAAGAARFINEVNPERLAQIQVLEIGIPSPDLIYTERLQDTWNTHAQIYGADELTERVVLFQFEGHYYYMGFTLLRYDENWKISNAASALGNTSAFGVPQITTEEAFREAVGGN